MQFTTTPTTDCVNAPGLSDTTCRDSADSVVVFAAAPTSRKNSIRDRCMIVLYVTVIAWGFGLSMFLNGIAARIMPASSICERVYVLASGRAVALLGVYGLLRLHAWRSGAAPTSSDIVSIRLLLPVSVGVTNTVAYAAYMALCTLSGVALWSGMVAAYIIVPVTYGILVRRESKSPVKLAGIAACVVGAVLLGMAGVAADADEAVVGDSTAAVVLKLALFAAAVAGWSLSDGCSAYMLTPSRGRPAPLRMTTLTLYTSLGFLVAAWAAASGTAMSVSDAAGPGDGSLAAASPQQRVAGYAIMLLAQALGMAAWYSVVQLGTMAEASSFVPLISLDSFIPALLGVTVLHERVGSSGFVGIGLAAAGVTMISVAGIGSAARSEVDATEAVAVLDAGRLELGTQEAA